MIKKLFSRLAGYRQWDVVDTPAYHGRHRADDAAWIIQAETDMHLINVAGGVAV